MSDEIKILGIAASLRAGSFNRSLLRAAKALAPDNAHVEIFDLAAIPLYNGDVEAAGDPPGVAAFKEAIRASHGILMVTPEYNHGVPDLGAVATAMLKAFGAGALIAMVVETIKPEAFHNLPRYSGVLAAAGFATLILLGELAG